MRKWAAYEKKYKSSWEALPDFKGWLKKSNADVVGKEAYCVVCCSHLRAHKSDLIKHGSTAQHKKNMCKINIEQQPRVTNFVVHTQLSRQEKNRDLRLAAHVAVHSSIQTIDHLGELLSDLAKGSQLENLKLHRTKCSKLIYKVISPAILKEIIDDIGSSGYSIILDESTDVSVIKYLAFCVRYHSKNQKTIITDFLGIAEVTKTTAQDLYKCTTEFLMEVGLQINKLIGIGTDGPSNLCGKNNSLYTLLKEDVPTLQLIPCICHSLHLCSSKAANELPSSLEFLLQQTRSWFSYSPLRQDEYASLFKTMNDGGKQFHKLVQLSKTRWLAFSAAVEKILDQWVELKTYFSLVTGGEDKSYMAKTLSCMYNDDTSLLYLIFLRPVLKEIVRVNLVFQKDNPEVTKSFEDLRVLLMLNARRIIKPLFLNAENCQLRSDVEMVAAALENPLAFLTPDNVDFGIKFNSYLEKKTISAEQINTVRYRCNQFLIKLCQELVNRLPKNFSLLEAVKHFDPKSCTSHFQQPFKDLPLSFFTNTNNLDMLEEQWRKIPLIKWFESEETLNQNSRIFWAKVYSYTDAGGSFCFKEIAEFALNALALPYSNAVVERLFSVMNAVKTKARNRMQLEMLSAILRVRIHFRVQNICCTKFQPTDEMRRLFNASILYSKAVKAPNDNGEGTSRSSEEENEDDAFMEVLTIFPSDD